MLTIFTLITFPVFLFVVLGLRKYLCVNGSSLAPIIALDLKPDVKVLDLCAGPGTKSLLTLMTNCPESLTCNDIQLNRLNRIHRIFEEFVGKFSIKYKNLLTKAYFF